MGHLIWLLVDPEVGFVYPPYKRDYLYNCKGFEVEHIPIEGDWIKIEHGKPDFQVTRRRFNFCEGSRSGEHIIIIARSVKNQIALGRYMLNERIRRQEERLQRAGWYKSGRDGLWRCNGVGGSYKLENAIKRQRRREV